MRRDKELVRKLLLYIEQNQTESGISLLFGKDKTFEEYSSDEEVYHLKLLEDANLIEGKHYLTNSSNEYLVKRITNYGHDFIDAIRDDNVWKKIKEKTGDAGSFTLGIIKELGTSYLKEKLGLN